jgi:hypothetical protein
MEKELHVKDGKKRCRQGETNRWKEKKIVDKDRRNNGQIS